MPELVGLIPAAGKATRLGNLPCSKEILPLGAGPQGDAHVACEPLLRSMQHAGVRRVYWVLRDGKYDIPRYLGDGQAYGLSMAYLVMRESPSTAHTLDHAYPFVAESTVVLGFPDILFSPTDAIARLVAAHDAPGVEVTLGLLTVDSPENWDVVILDSHSRVAGLRIKQPPNGNDQGWLLAVWGPSFTHFLHEYLAARRPAAGPEIYVGTVIEAAIAAGMGVQGVEITNGACVDVGTPENLCRVLASGGLAPFL